MKHPINEQLRRYAQSVVGGLNPVTATEASTTRLSPIERRRPRPAWLMTAAAVSVTLVIGGVLALVIPRLRSDSPDPIPAATTAAPVASTTTTTPGATTVPSVVIPACPIPARLPDWASGEGPFADLHAAVSRVVVAVNQLPGAIAAETDFSGEWIETPPTDSVTLELFDATRGVRDSASAIAADPRFDQLGPEARAAVARLASLDTDPTGTLGELTDTRSREQARAFLVGGGSNPSPCEFASGVVAMADTVIEYPPDPNAPRVGACPGPAPLPAFAQGNPLYEAFHASTERLVEAVNRIPVSLPEEEELNEGWTLRPPMAGPVAEVLAASAQVSSDASAILSQLGYEWDGVQGAWIPPAETTADLDGAIYLEILSGSVDPSDLFQGTLTEVIMAVSLDYLDGFRSREEVLGFLLTPEPTEGQPCYEVTGLVRLADEVFDPPPGPDGPPEPGACPLPDPVPDRLAADPRFVDLHNALVSLAEAVNRLPSAVAEATDFSAGWTDQPPVDTAMLEIREATMEVVGGASAILRSLGVTGDPLTGWTYPENLIPVTPAVSHMEEITMSGLAMDDSLTTLDQQRSLDQAMEFLAYGRLSAAPCGPASWAVGMWNEAAPGWPTSEP